MSTNDHWINCPYCAGAGISRADQGMFTDDEITQIGEPLKANCPRCAATGTALG